MNALQSLSLSGFKSIREMKEPLKFTPLNVLIGANGAGKSNLISYFRLLKWGMVHGGDLAFFVGKEGGANTLLHFGAQRTNRIESSFILHVDEKSVAYDVGLSHAAGDSLIFERQSLDGVLLETETQVLGNPVRFLFSRIGIYQFHDTSSTSPMRQKTGLNYNREFWSDGGNLAAMLYYLQEKQPQAYRQIVDIVRLGLPFFENFALAPDRLNPHFIDLRWREKGAGYEMGPHQIADGALRYMALVTLLSQPVEDLPSIIIIDEPELGLHPAATEILAELLKKVSASTQVIVATQSAHLVDQMEAEDIIVVEREEGQSVFKRLRSDELTGWLEEYGVGDLWLKNVIGGRP